MSRARDLADSADLNFDDGTFVIDSANNRVGIGTSSPAVKMDLSQSTNDSVIRIDAGVDAFMAFGANGTATQNWHIGTVDSDSSFRFYNGNYGSGTERMRLDSSGKLALADGIGTTSGAILEVRNNTASEVATFARGSLVASPARGLIIFRDASNGNILGSISNTTSSTVYNTSSDYRLKENVVDMTDSISRLKQLKPSQFNFIISPEVTVDGFLAHEVQDIVPEAITGEKDAVQVWQEGEELPEGVSVGDNKLDENGNTIPDYQGIDQSKLVPLLTGALQEAIARIETLETTQADLVARIEALEAN